MEKNGKGWKGAWQLDKWKWQVSNPQTNAWTAVFILEDKNYLRTGFLEKRKQLCFPSLEWFFFFLIANFLKNLKNWIIINTCTPACLCVCVCVCVCYFLSRVQLLAHQAPLSMGFSRQEYWSG